MGAESLVYPLASGDGMQEWDDTKSDVNSLSRSYVKQRASNGWDPGPPIEVTDTILINQSHSKGACEANGVGDIGSGVRCGREIKLVGIKY